MTRLTSTVALTAALTLATVAVAGTNTGSSHFRGSYRHGRPAAETPKAYALTGDVAERSEWKLNVARRAFDKGGPSRVTYDRVAAD